MSDTGPRLRGVWRGQDCTIVGDAGDRLVVVVDGYEASNEAARDEISGLHIDPPGRWPDHCEQRAFVAGAAWWEFVSTGGTMWPSDRDRAEVEAVKRYGDPRASAVAGPTGGDR